MLKRPTDLQHKLHPFAFGLINRHFLVVINQFSKGFILINYQILVTLYACTCSLSIYIHTPQKVNAFPGNCLKTMVTLFQWHRCRLDLGKYRSVDAVVNDIAEFSRDIIVPRRLKKCTFCAEVCARHFAVFVESGNSVASPNDY